MNRRPFDSPNSPPTITQGRLNLLFDADDTLWENAYFFDEARRRFMSAMKDAGPDWRETRRTLDACERKHLDARWFGGARLGQSMRETAVILLGGRAAPLMDLATSLVPTITDHPIRLYPCVVPVLTELRRRHRLFLVTMGDAVEQSRKIERSRLAKFFEKTIIVREKTAEAYRELGRELSLEPEATWMIGNSKKRDVDAAIAAGFHAVHFLSVDGAHLGGSAPEAEPERKIVDLLELLPMFGSRA